MHTNLGMYTKRTPNRKEFSINSVNTKLKREYAGLEFILKPCRVIFVLLSFLWGTGRIMMESRKKHFSFQLSLFFRLFLSVPLYFLAAPLRFSSAPTNL